MKIMLILGSFFLVISPQVRAQIPFMQGEADADLLKARIADFNPPDKGLPENEYSLVEERRSIEAEIVNLRNIAQRATDVAEIVEAIDRAKEIVSGALAEISRLDCKKLANGQFRQYIFIRENLTTLQGKMGYYPWYREIDDPYLYAPWATTEKVSDELNCIAWKNFVGDATKQMNLITYFDKLKARALEEVKSQSESRTLATNLIEVMQKRKDIVDQRLKAQSTKAELADKLWIVIGVIGVFSILAILAVKLFGENIQLEWVASGQVIQFVTVMILLSVIMALGLAGILKENTLGTLLGGIAGYVLAQGVGRAAAREVSRGRERYSDVQPEKSGK